MGINSLSNGLLDIFFLMLTAKRAKAPIFIWKTCQTRKVKLFRVTYFNFL